MSAESRIAFSCLFAWISLATSPSLGAEPTETMRTFARMFAALDARDLPGYCESKLSAPYLDYMNRVCQSAVLNRVKTTEDCSQQNIALQSKRDAAECLAMPAAEFEKLGLRGTEVRNAFAEEAKKEGVDSERLIHEERVNRR